eukprot:TRINITY_DN22521_c0_g1_i1.p2 TRINITY_DN22521_c0_g1~~TRINITY_DN22521_c0_g1_i1.p2  ORF type:complete len:199 (+),score=26.67 TRINITY_DN22521_c0_g1_i1:69-665(+)
MPRDILSELSFYGSYHADPLNQLVHVIFVPLIMATFVTVLAYSGPLFDPFIIPFFSMLPTHMQHLLTPNAGLAVVLAYWGYYLYLALLPALTWLPFVGFPVLLVGNALYLHTANPLMWAGLLHVVSWAAQVIIGHGIFEKRKPALVDSLVQAFALAPLFVWVEVLFFCGFFRRLRDEVKTRVSAAIRDMDANAARKGK